MYPNQLLRLAIRRAHRPQPFRSTAPMVIRPFSQTPLSCYPRVDSQDKDSIDTEATEYSKSGTDDGVARQEEAAFDPKKTSPEQEKKTAGEGTEESGNPLDVSPANSEVSKPTKQEGAEKSEGTPKQSGGKGTGGGSSQKV